MLEVVTFTAGGRQLPHTRCSLNASAEKAVREASFDIAWNGDGLPCQVDDEATVEISGRLWGTGYVSAISASHDERMRAYVVSFSSRTIDAVEASVKHPTGLKENGDLLAIAKEFDTIGVGVEGDAKTEVKPIHKVRPGESLFDTIEPDARAQGVLIMDTEQGRLKLVDKPEGRHAGALVRGLSFKQASAQLSGGGNFSEVTVRGQASVGVTQSQLHPEGKAKGAARRNRPLIVLHEGEATSGRLKKRADWEARRAAGEGISATVTLPGWRDEGGRLWTRNWLVSVEDDWIGISQDMLIASVSLEQDSRAGTAATLTLKDPRALGGQNPRGSSAATWSAPGGLAPEYSEG